MIEEKRRQKTKYTMKIAQEQDYEMMVAAERERQNKVEPVWPIIYILHLKVSKLERQARAQEDLVKRNKNVESPSRRDIKYFSDEEDEKSSECMSTLAQTRPNSLDDRTHIRAQAISSGLVKTKSGFSFPGLR